MRNFNEIGNVDDRISVKNKQKLHYHSWHPRNLVDFVAKYEKTSTTALSANRAVAVPLLTISGWIVMQRKVTGDSVSFQQNWAEYRDGFGSAAGNDNYWLGLDKVYRLMQLGNARLRVEVLKWLSVLLKASVINNTKSPQKCRFMLKKQVTTTATTTTTTTTITITREKQK